MRTELFALGGAAATGEDNITDTASPKSILQTVAVLGLFTMSRAVFVSIVFMVVLSFMVFSVFNIGDTMTNPALADHGVKPYPKR